MESTEGMMIHRAVEEIMFLTSRTMNDQDMNQVYYTIHTGNLASGSFTFCGQKIRNFPYFSYTIVFHFSNIYLLFHVLSTRETPGGATSLLV